MYPFGLLWNEVTASNLLLVDMEGKVISGHGQPEATAFWIHRYGNLKLKLDVVCDHAEHLYLLTRHAEVALLGLLGAC